MANSPQARKRNRQAETRRRHNTSLRSMARTYIKKVLAAIEAGDAKLAQEAYKTAVPALDRMVNKGLFKKNKVARHKSRLNAKIKALS